jgi:hypothetical protein
MTARRRAATHSRLIDKACVGRGESSEPARSGHRHCDRLAVGDARGLGKTI